MASGTFRTPTCTAAGSGHSRYIYVNWSSTNDTANNKSTISWTAYGGSDDSSKTSYVMTGPVVIKINGTTVLNKQDRFQLKKDVSFGNGSLTVDHDADGRKNVSVSISANIYIGSDHDPNNTYSGTITLTPNPVYTLSISAGTGSSITVNRTSCAGIGSAGVLSAGTKKLCYGDVLKITFTPSSNYSNAIHTVNGVSFTSGNSHTVVGGVSVVTTATPLQSRVGATNADIGSVSTITVTRYNSAYYHSLQYSFGSLSGYITSSGDVSATEVKFNDISVPFKIPDTFYTQIPREKSGVCTITCRTYSSSTSASQFGSSTSCQITVTASYDLSAPVVSGSVIDINEATKALTGDETVLVRYKSVAQCTISATPINSAIIVAKYINDSTTSTDTRTIEDVATNNFVFRAVDSRGYTVSKTVSPTMVAYVPLTCNPIISRPTPTGKSIVLSVTGNIYRGSFGVASNSLTLQFRYRESDGAYSDWETVDSTQILFGTSSYTGSPISLGDSFDYRKSYTFQIKAVDGTTECALSTVTKTIPIQKGEPIFDWGENDFNINVPLMLRNVNILNIIYPIGSVYMHSDSSLPSAIAGIGTWESVTTGIAQVYAWKRTE